jgi:hypothetical protein
MRQRPAAADLLRRIAPDAVRSGVRFSVPPERIELAPWLADDPGRVPSDALVRTVWSYGIDTPLVGRQQTADTFQLIAEAEFLAAARAADLTTVRLLVVHIADAPARAVASAVRLLGTNGDSDIAGSVGELQIALGDAGVTPRPDQLMRLARRDEDAVVELLATLCEDGGLRAVL